MPELKASRPNIVLIMIDDLAYGDLACHGNPHIRTPHLDQMHAEGTRLTRYCSGPLCTPARAAAMTGRHPFRTGAIDTYIGRSNMHPDEVTLPQVLRDAGYATGMFGKWHLGDAPGVRPHERGFDHAVMHGGGGLTQYGDPLPFHQPNSYFDPILSDNGKPRLCHGYNTDVYFDEACAWISHQQDKPFFAYLGTTAPHSPFQIAEEWIQPYRDMGLIEKLARLYAMVENLDACVGRLFAYLKEAGLDDNTLVIFTADHGPCPSAALDTGDPRWNAGLRGFKSNFYEGGIRVANLWRCPPLLEAGKDIGRVTNPIDLMPTLVAMAGGTMPTDRTIDGTDLTPLLAGDDADWPDRSITMQWHRGDVPIKYFNATVIEDRYKWVRTDDGPEELYDLQNDPHEKTDIAATQPDRVATMRSIYDDWFADVCNERGEETFKPYPIPLGLDSDRGMSLNRQEWRMYDDCEEEGWDDAKHGWWPVRVVADDTYRVVIHVPNPQAGETLTFKCQNETRTVDLSPGVDVYCWDKIQLTEGEAKLEASITSASGVRGALRVDVVRCVTRRRI